MQRTRFVVLKFLFYACVAVLLAVVQNTPGLLSIAGTKPMLVAAFAVAVAMFEGAFAGARAGAFGGMLCDLFSYYRSGYYALIFFGCCLVVMNCCLFTLCAMLLSQGVAFFFLFLIRGYPGTELLFLFRMLPMCGYTAVMAAPAFFAVRRAHLWFQKKILPEGT